MISACEVLCKSFACFSSTSYRYADSARRRLSEVKMLSRNRTILDNASLALIVAIDPVDLWIIAELNIGKRLCQNQR